MFKNLKRIILYSLLLVEIAIFSYSYLFGKNGIYLLINLKNENQTIKNQVITIKKDISELKRQMQEWDDDPFYKEKIARESLQMARKNEQVYYI